MQNHFQYKLTAHISDQQHSEPNQGPTGRTAAAQVFSNGTPYQTLMLQGGVTTTIALQWAVPWPTSGQTVPDLLTCGLFDASGARFALVFGEDELAQGCVTVKPLRDGGAQRLAPLQEAAVWAGTLQSKA